MEHVFARIFKIATEFTLKAAKASNDPQFAPKETKDNKDLLTFDFEGESVLVKKINKLLELGQHDDDLSEFEGIINTIFGSKSKIAATEFHKIFDENPKTHWFTKASEIRKRFTRLIDDETRDCVQEV